MQPQHLKQRRVEEYLLLDSQPSVLQYRLCKAPQKAHSTPRHLHHSATKITVSLAAMGSFSCTVGPGSRPNSMVWITIQQVLEMRGRSQGPHFFLRYVVRLASSGILKCA